MKNPIPHKTLRSGGRASGEPWRRGFTLIELLVVIAIIAMLASIILASLNAARNKAADVRRKADLKQLQTALELYYSDNNAYPSTGGVWYGNSPNAGSRTNYIPGLAPQYIQTLPLDPSPAPSACGGWGGAYLYISDGAGYKLLSHCPQNSSVGSTPSTDAFYDPVRSTWAWQVCSGTTECQW